MKNVFIVSSQTDRSLVLAFSNKTKAFEALAELTGKSFTYIRDNFYDNLDWNNVSFIYEGFIVDSIFVNVNGHISPEKWDSLKNQTVKQRENEYLAKMPKKGLYNVWIPFEGYLPQRNYKSSLTFKEEIEANSAFEAYEIGCEKIKQRTATTGNTPYNFEPHMAEFIK